MKVATLYLESSGHQVSLNDPTSHHLFAILKPHRSQSRLPSALKVAGCNEPIVTYNLFVSDFVYRDDLRSGQFLDFPIISHGGKIKWLIFSQIPVVIATAIMDDTNHDHPRLPRCKFGYVTAVRLCDVIKQKVLFFGNSFT